MDEFTARIREAVKEDIVTNDDGYRVYWPGLNGGYFEAPCLRIIADYLDELNAAWHAQVMSDPAINPPKER